MKIPTSTQQLKLPPVTGVRERLQEKLQEYNDRIERLKREYQVKSLGIVIDHESNILDAVYKTAIVRSLLDRGMVDLAVIHDELRKQFNDHVSEEIFCNAINVISDYLKTGGMHTQGGSGFFTDDMLRQLLKKTPVLECPDADETRARLEEKYYEYLGREVEYERKSDTTVDRAAMNRNRYRVRLLADLREHKRILVEEVADDIRHQENSRFDKMEYYKAVNDIRDLMEPAAASVPPPGRTPVKDER